MCSCSRSPTGSRFDAFRDHRVSCVAFRSLKNLRDQAMPPSPPLPSSSSPHSGSGDLRNLPPGLLNLIRAPKRLSALRLWKALEPGERVTVLKGHIRDQTNRTKLVRIVAAERNFREITVRRWDDDKIVKWVLPLRLPNTLARDLLLEMHIERRRDMLAHFLNALEIPNDDGIPELDDETGEFGHQDVRDEAVHEAAEDLVGEHGLRRVVVYFLTLDILGTPFTDHLWSWMKRSLERTPRDTTDEPAAAEPDDEDLYEEGVEQESDLSRHRSFTTLDRLLIEAIVDSKQEVVGSLTAEEVDDAVDEFVSLNGRRQHSYFHLGFRDVLFLGKPRREIPATNRKRARWYWAGAILAWARSGSWPEVVAAYDDHSEVRSLGDGTDFATEEAARQVVHALRHSGRSAEVAGFVKVRGILDSPALFREMLNIGTELLRRDEVGQARTIFDRLMDAVRALVRGGQAPAFQPFLVVRRRLAHCLQRALEHDEARRQLENLLSLDSNPNHLAMVHADLGLLAGRFNSLEEVCLPRETGELADLVDRLREGRDNFLESIQNDVSYAAHGHYCLGVLALGENVLKRSETSYPEAADHFLRAHSRFGGQAKDYGAALVARTSLYLGIAQAASADSAGTVSHAANVMVRALQKGAVLPPYLVELAVDGLALGAGADDLTRFARALLSTEEETALTALSRSAVAVEQCEEVRDGLRRRAKQLGKSEAAAMDLRACLAGYLKAGRTAEAQDVLDWLEALAARGIGSVEFEELLSKKRFQPAWEPEEASIAYARCLENKGNYVDALQVLQPLVHQFAGEGKLDDAEGLLDRVRSYGLSEDHYADAAGRVGALLEQSQRYQQHGTPVEKKAVRPVRILFVGGDERQAKAEAAVREQLRERAPHIDVTFIHPGWSGNWSRHLDKVRRELPNHDALVVMRFIRTELGKQVRKNCGKPWRSCWASGTQGMADSIVAAAGAASAAG